VPGGPSVLAAESDRAAHLGAKGAEIRLRRQFLDRLEAVAARLRSAEEVSAEELVQTAMEVIEMSERYYTPEQLEYLEQRRRELGEERIHAVEAEWPELMERVRVEMEAGTDPANERVQRLAKR
jgi:hemerythrin-like domain-containing protein